MRNYIDIQHEGPIFNNAVTVSGRCATGKSTIMRQLKTLLNNEQDRVLLISAGSMMRSIASELNLTIEEFTEYARDSPVNYDRECDIRQQRYGRRNNTFLEGHIVELFTPYSFHVLVKCPLETRAERRQREERYSSLNLEEVRELIDKRDRADDLRYMSRYGTTGWSEEHFDYVIHSDVTPIEEMGTNLINAHLAWLKQNGSRVIYRLP